MRIYARRGAGRLCQRMADSELRLALGVLSGRRGAASARGRHDDDLARVPAIPGAQGSQGTCAGMARTLRSHVADWRNGDHRGPGKEHRWRACCRIVPRGPYSGDADSVVDQLHEPDRPVLPVELAADRHARCRLLTGNRGDCWYGIADGRRARHLAAWLVYRALRLCPSPVRMLLLRSHLRWHDRYRGACIAVVTHRRIRGRLLRGRRPAGGQCTCRALLPYVGALDGNRLEPGHRAYWLGDRAAGRRSIDRAELV